MSNDAFWFSDWAIDDLVPNFSDDFDDAEYDGDMHPNDYLLADPPLGPFDTRPVTVTDADLWPGNIVRLDDEEAWHPGVVDGE